MLGAAIRSHIPAFDGLRHESCQCIEKCGIVLLVHIIQIPQTAVAYFGAWTMEAKPRLTRRIKRSHIVGQQSDGIPFYVSTTALRACFVRDLHPQNRHTSKVGRHSTFMGGFAVSYHPWCGRPLTPSRHFSNTFPIALKQGGAHVEPENRTAVISATVLASAVGAEARPESRF